VRERGRAPAHRGGLVAHLGLTCGASASVWPLGGARGLSPVSHDPELMFWSIWNVETSPPFETKKRSFFLAL
jgi:hypothetical protein